MTIIDDYSRWTTVYAMKNKSDSLQCFKIFHKAAEAHTRRKIKTIRSDNGGEYNSSSFRQYLDSHGILHQTTIPYTPQQNGVAERMNRTLINLVRSMLQAKDVGKSFWAEALQTAVYIRNRVTSSSLPPNITPHHLWYSSPPDLSHARVFGCQCYYVLPKMKVKKLDARSREAIFIGYLTQSKGYKVWDIQLCKCVASRDVKFLETCDPPTNDTSSNDCHSVDLPTMEHSGKAEEVMNRGGETTVRFNTASAHDENESDQSSDAEEVDTQNECTEPLQRLSSLPTTEPRRSTRQRQNTGEWWKASANIALSARVVPPSYKVATSMENIDFWMPGIEREHDCLLRNKTWKLVNHEQGMHVLPCKYVFRIKNGAPKARLVALGCLQLYGVDYLETFAPVVKVETIRMLLALAAMLDLECEQMDVVTAFLNGDLEEDIFMEVPQGLKSKANEGKVCKLLKSLYGLKQAPRQWYAKIHEYFVNCLGFSTSLNDPCLYIRHSSSYMILVALYVDDLLIVGNSKQHISNLKGELSKRFEMKDLGPAQTMLGVEIRRNRSERKLSISQIEYTEQVLKRFGMESCRSTDTPMQKSGPADLNLPDQPLPTNVPFRQAIGSLIYLVSCTRPDIAFAVHRLSQSVESPQNHHWTAVKHVLRYLSGTKSFGIQYGGSNNKGDSIIAYSDSDYAGDTASRKSTSGYILLLSGGSISWKSKKQPIVATSSCEAEYIACCAATKEAIWLSRLYAEVRNVKNPTPITIMVDNNGTIDLAQNSTVGERSKHIDVKYHFVRESVQKKKVSLNRCDTADQVADPLTKPLEKVKHQKFTKLQGLSPVHDI